MFKKTNGMNTSHHNYDSIEQLISKDGLSIVKIDFHKDLDLMLIILNTKAILRQKISSFKTLANATEKQLNQYEFIGGGKGIHWPRLDEDLSLKGFLRQELINLVNKDVRAA